MAGARDTVAYTFVRWVLRLAVGFYFRRIERFHAERVPRTGAAVFVSNHPNSLTDAFILGVAVARQVHFVATVLMFKAKPLAWLFDQCGVIPVTRRSDDPRGVRSLVQTFKSCFEVLKRGGAVAMFPEGITHDDPQLKNVQSGAARLALDFANRFETDTVVVPVGLVFADKHRYRSDVLVHFGEPIEIGAYLEDHADDKRGVIERLNGEIRARLESLILHVPRLEQARVVEAVTRLYLERLRLGNIVIQEPVPTQVEDLVLTQTIAKGVEYVARIDAPRYARFVDALERYETLLQRLRLSDEDIAALEPRRGSLPRTLGRAVLAVIGAPVAAYGWLHRLVPIAVVQWAVHRFAHIDRFKAQVSLTAIAAGLVSFGLFYGLLFAAAQRIVGWPTSLVYLLSLPVSGLVAHYYLQQGQRLWRAARRSLVLFRLKLGSAARLRRMRRELIKEIEALRYKYRAEFLES